MITFVPQATIALRGQAKPFLAWLAFTTPRVAPSPHLLASPVQVCLRCLCSGGILYAYRLACKTAGRYACFENSLEATTEALRCVRRRSFLRKGGYWKPFGLVPRRLLLQSRNSWPAALLAWHLLLGWISGGHTVPSRVLLPSYV